jgi:hypothetical protein
MDSTRGVLPVPPVVMFPILNTFTGSLVLLTTPFYKGDFLYSVLLNMDT